MEWDSFKKKRPILSLSRTRTKKQKTETSSHDELAAVKEESNCSVVKYEVQTQSSSLDNVISKENEKIAAPLRQKPVTPEIKTESSSLKLQDSIMESQPLCQEKINLDVSLSVPKSDVKEEGDVKFIIEQEEEEEVEALLSSIDHEQTVTEETIDTDEYHCPICNMPLASSSTLRQNHIEKCLEGGLEEERGERENLEFSQCFICSKDLSRLSAEQRGMHLNRCLDTKQAEEKKIKDSTFAGQSIPYIDVLNDCPVCHLPFKSKVLTHKIAHLKKCSRKNNISAELLKQKCRWIEWGHMPLTTEASDTNDKSSKQSIPSYFYATDTHDDGGFEEYDDDFNDTLIVHRAVSNKKLEKRMDQQDEELQAALAMSLSLQVKKPKKRTFEPNAADIWTPEESRSKSLEKLKLLSLEKKPLPQFNISFKPTRFTTTHSPSLWKLASLRVESTYASLFIQELYASDNKKRKKTLI